CPPPPPQRLPISIEARVRRGSHPPPPARGRREERPAVSNVSFHPCLRAIGQRYPEWRDAASLWPVCPPCLRHTRGNTTTVPAVPGSAHKTMALSVERP